MNLTITVCACARARACVCVCVCTNSQFRGQIMCTNSQFRGQIIACLCVRVVHVCVQACIYTYLVVWVRYHWWLPLSVHVLVPVLRHLGIRISYILRLDPVLHIQQCAHCPGGNSTHTDIHIIFESVPNGIPQVQATSLP